MMHVRHPLVPDGRGRRTRQTELLISERDRYLREAAARFCTSMSDRQAAAWLHTKISRYRSGAWRRDRVDATIEPRCPVRYRGTLTELLWCVLRTREHVPSEMTVRRALAFRDPPDMTASGHQRVIGATKHARASDNITGRTRRRFTADEFRLHVTIALR